ncbi:hypothetical protein GCM10012279_58380 [Micromonospora yangpuensis]|nr:hypothetical protein GCM10012279_58380 [Micromonospora yangpuensis]
MRRLNTRISWYAAYNEPRGLQEATRLVAGPHPAPAAADRWKLDQCGGVAGDQLLGSRVVERRAQHAPDVLDGAGGQHVTAAPAERAGTLSEFRAGVLALGRHWQVRATSLIQWCRV